MKSIRCPRCKTVTFAEKKRCPRCNYDFSKFTVRIEPITPSQAAKNTANYAVSLLSAASYTALQAAKNTVKYVGKQLTIFFGTLALIFEKLGGYVRSAILFTAVLVGKTIGVTLNVLFTPIFYAGEKLAAGARHVFYISVRIFAATLVFAATLKSSAQSLPERFKRKPKRLEQRGRRPVGVRPVAISAEQRQIESAPVTEILRRAAIEAVPPLIRRIPVEVVKEAVDVVPAGIFPRFLAGIVDILIISVTVSLMLVPAWLAGSFNLLSLSPERVAKVSLTIYLFALAVAGIYLVVAMSVYGKTFGKKLFRLRVIRVSGEPLGLYDSFVRFSAWLISGLFFGLGWLWLVFDINHRSFHDYLSQTVVIRDAS